MKNPEYLFLIKDIENNRVKFVSYVDVNEGVTTSDGKTCAVLKRYTLPVGIEEVKGDIEKYCAAVSGLVRQVKRNTLGKVYKDYLGNEFETIYQMCSYYKISESKYRSRIANGWTNEEALTGIRKKKQVTDHLGNVFDSKSEMCQFYGIREKTYNARISAGKSIEEALLGVDEEETYSIEDHLGNKYINTSQMCKTYGVRLDTYCQRKKRGWTLEEILTGKKKSEPVSDHKGNMYSDIDDMCLEYGIKKTIYLSRINRGWTVGEALTGVRNDNVVRDHLGNIYITQKEMCEKYGIKVVTFRSRLKRGLTLEEALTTDVSHARIYINGSLHQVTDHLGNSYTTQKEMCEKYGIKVFTFQNRLKRGLTLEEALTSEVRYARNNNHPETDHLGNVYSDIKEMCKAYGIRVDTFKARLKSGKSLEEALTRVPSKITTNIPCKDHLGNQYLSQTEMARAYGLTKGQFIARKRSGWSIEKILTTPVNERGLSTTR